MSNDYQEVNYEEKPSYADWVTKELHLDDDEVLSVAASVISEIEDIQGDPQISKEDKEIQVDISSMLSS